MSAERADLYPALTEQVRLKKMPSCCWVVDGQSNGERIHPLEAFVLSLCTGDNSANDIAYIVGGTLDRNADWSRELVGSALVRRSSYVRLFPDGAVRNGRYQSAEFLYPPQRTARSAEGRLDSPGELTLILTHRCNFKCIYCFNSAAPGTPHAMSTEDWSRVLLEAKGLGVVRCTVSGGEPMTHPGFRSILAQITSHDMVPYVCTNGSLISKDDIRYFADIGMAAIQVSLDTVDARTHDRMSAAPGSFGRVRAAIEALVEAGITVLVKSVITPINLPGVADLIDSCHGWGVKRVTLDRFDLSNAGRGNEHLFLTPAMEQEMGQLARQRQARYGADGFVVTAVDLPRCWSSREDIIVCGALSTGMTILPDGRVSVCEKLIDHVDLTVGDLRLQSMEQIWNSPRAQEVLRPFRDRVDPVCRDCPELAACHTGCFAQTLIVTDDPYAPDPRCWRADYATNPYTQYAAGEISHG